VVPGILNEEAEVTVSGRRVDSTSQRRERTNNGIRKGGKGWESM